MAPAYQNINSGQIVVSDEPRPDLEALARWEEVPVPDETADVIETIPGTESNPPIEIIGEPVEDGEIVTPAVVEMADGSEVEKDENGIPVLTAAQEVPVPDETWTDEQLDALAEQRGVKYRSNASKATKLAKLTE